MIDVIHYPTPPEPTSTAKEYLSRARTLDSEINCKLEQIAQLEAQMTRCAQVLSDMPGGGPRDWTDIVAKALDLKQQLDGDIDRLIDVKREIRAAIAAVENPTYRQLLEMRYLCGWSWQRVADEMHYSREAVCRIHKKALYDIIPHDVIG